MGQKPFLAELLPNACVACNLFTSEIPRRDTRYPWPLNNHAADRKTNYLSQLTTFMPVTKCLLRKCEWNQRKERVMSTPRYGLKEWGVKVWQQIPQKRLARWRNGSERNPTPAPGTQFVPPCVYRLSPLAFSTTVSGRVSHVRFKHSSTTGQSWLLVRNDIRYLVSQRRGQTANFTTRETTDFGRAILSVFLYC